MKTYKIIAFVVVAVALILGGRWYAAKLDEKSAADQVAVQAKATQDQSDLLKKLTIEDQVVGTGAEAKTGDTVSVNYIGTFTDGKVFDSSYERHQALDVVLGESQVIKGWDLGIPGMKVGGKRKLVVPPELGYGAQAYGIIPPSSTLMFTIELMAVNGATSTAPALR